MQRTFGFLFLAACGQANDFTTTNAIGETSAAMQAGNADNGDAAVGMLWLQDGGFCSGVLVAPNVVLTAGHCANVASTGFYLGAGSAISTQKFRGPPANMTQLDVAEWQTAPGYVAESCGTSSDVGLVRLRCPTNAAAPVAVSSTPLAVGASCTAVGFGKHDDNGQTYVGQKRSGDEQISQVLPYALGATSAGGIADSGDSGGPFLCDGQIAGVNSCGNADSNIAYIARTDVVADWIARTVADWQPTNDEYCVAVAAGEHAAVTGEAAQAVR